jgi:Protein of unknown function (DUF3140)
MVLMHAAHTSRYRALAASARGRSLPVDERRSVERRFRRAVNMSAAALRAWIARPESRRVGFTHAGERESVGHQSGREIIRLLERGPQTDADYRWMRKVCGYVFRHLAQRPAGDVSRTPWRYSLMNWGHDPMAPASRR